MNPSNDTENYICMLHDLFGIDIIYATKKINEAIEYYGSGIEKRDYVRAIKQLEVRWYAALLENNMPDYSVYRDELFLYDLWACWKIYSHKYLKNIASKKALPSGKSIIEDMGHIKTVLDIGCGIGYTTAELKRLIPSASIYGYDLADSLQYGIAEYNSFVGQYEMLPSLDLLYNEYKQIDLIFASEYFEHIENAIPHLEQLILLLRPKYLIIANAFNAISVGHFLKFQWRGKYYSAKKTNHLFDALLKDVYSYQKVITNLENNRPLYWKKLIQ